MWQEELLVEICGTITYCCNKGKATADIAVGGIAGNNKGNIEYVYNIAEEIKALRMHAGGIVGTQNVKSTSSIKYAYNASKISGNSSVGGILALFNIGTVENTYNMGVVNATSNVDVGQIIGGGTAGTPSNSKPVTEAEMKGWNQATINSNLQNFVKKENSLPILNITVRNVTF